MLTDGAAEPEATFYSTYNVEGIEVLKGPAGFLYGSNPLAGAVNIVRKQPQPTSFTNIGFSGGSFNTYQGDVDWNLSNADGDLAFRINAHYRESDGYRDRTDSELAAVNPAFTWESGPRHNVLRLVL